MDVMLLVETCISGMRQPGDIETAVAAGADVNGFHHGQSPLMRAVSAQRGDIATVLLRAKADPNMPDVKGVSPLHMAVFDGGFDMIMRLLDGRADPEKLDRVGQTPLFFAPHAQACDQLARAGANPNVFNHKGQSPLHLAAHAGLNESVLWLAQHMTIQAINAQDEEGRTAVWCAALANLKPTIALLQEYGADVQLRPFKITQVKTATTPKKSMQQADMSVLSGASTVPNMSSRQLQPQETQQRRQWVQDNSVLATPDSRVRKADNMSTGGSRNDFMVATGQSDSFMFSPKRVQEYSEHEMSKTLATQSTLVVPQPREHDIYFSPSAEAKGWISNQPLVVQVAKSVIPETVSMPPVEDMFASQFLGNVQAPMTWPQEEAVEVTREAIGPSPHYALDDGPSPPPALTDEIPMEVAEVDYTNSWPPPVDFAEPAPALPLYTIGTAPAAPPLYTSPAPEEARKETPPLPPAPEEPRKEERTFISHESKVFSHIDSDNDGLLTRGEFTDAYNEGKIKTIMGGAVHRMIDTNKDGVVDSKEFKTAVASGVVQAPADTSGEERDPSRRMSTTPAELEEAIRKIQSVQRGRVQRWESQKAQKNSAVPVLTHDFFGATKWDIVLTKHDNKTKYGFWHENAKVELARDYTKALYRDDNVPADLNLLSATERPEALIVKRIVKKGLLEEWNAVHPEAEVHAGDRVIKVNNSTTIMEMQKELRAATCTCTILRFPDVFHVQLDKSAKGLGFVADESSDSQGREELKVTEIAKGELLDEVNRKNMQTDCHHLVVLLGMRIEAVNNVEKDCVKMKEELLSSPVLRLRVRRADGTSKKAQMKAEI